MHIFVIALAIVTIIGIAMIIHGNIIKEFPGCLDSTISCEFIRKGKQSLKLHRI